VLQAALQAAWAEILVETASSFHGLDSPSKAALSCNFRSYFSLVYREDPRLRQNYCVNLNLHRVDCFIEFWDTIILRKVWFFQLRALDSHRIAADGP
jgi:hypothetical protein